MGCVSATECGSIAEWVFEAAVGGTRFRVTAGLCGGTVFGPEWWLTK